MEVEQFLKRVDWLDDEHRKDKNKLSALEEQIKFLEGGFPPVNQQIKELSAEISRLAAVITRMDHFDEVLLQQRIETKQIPEKLNKTKDERRRTKEKTSGPLVFRPSSSVLHLLLLTRPPQRAFVSRDPLMRNSQHALQAFLGPLVHLVKQIHNLLDIIL